MRKNLAKIINTNINWVYTSYSRSHGLVVKAAA